MHIHELHVLNRCQDGYNSPRKIAVSMALDEKRSRNWCLLPANVF